MAQYPAALAGSSMRFAISKLVFLFVTLPGLALPKFLCFVSLALLFLLHLRHCFLVPLPHVIVDAYLFVPSTSIGEMRVVRN